MGTSPKAGVIHQRLFRAIDKMRPGGRSTEVDADLALGLAQREAQEAAAVARRFSRGFHVGEFVAPRRRLRAGSRMVPPPKTTAPSSRTAAAGEGSRNGSCCGSGSVADLSAVFGRLTGRKALVKAKQSTDAAHVMWSRAAPAAPFACKSELLGCLSNFYNFSAQRQCYSQPAAFFKL